MRRTEKTPTIVVTVLLSALLCGLGALAACGSWWPASLQATPAHAAGPVAGDREPGGLPSATPVAAGAASKWQVWRQQLERQYGHTPLLVVGLGLLAVLVMMGLPGLVVGMTRSWRRRTAARRRAARLPEMEMRCTSLTPDEAWLACDGGDATRLPLHRRMIRVGRHRENDIRLEDRSVHRYHALIYWTPDDEYAIKDLSGSDGNGVAVNGAQVLEAPLRKGDVIEIGDVKMRFETSPA